MTTTTWNDLLGSSSFKIFLASSFFTIISDQLSKYFVETTKPIIQLSFLTIKYSTNTGAGFGLFQNNSFILGIISLIAAIAVLFYYPKIPQTKFNSIFMGILLGGIIGNGIDRLTKQYVVDFIATSFWPSFNIADAAITISTTYFIYYLLQEEKKIKKNKERRIRKKE